MKKILTTNSNFVDDTGRVYYFHGINIVDKGWTDKLRNNKRKDLWCQREFFKNPISLEELKILKSMGVNLIRLGITWECIEPEMDKYNEEAIEKLHNIVKMCEELGIRVLLDMHQDLYAGWGNSEGDGAPKWATLTDGIKFKYPKFVWAMGYFKGDAIARAFDNFWANTEIDGIGLQDRYANMWKHLVSSFTDCSNILGYDVLNEPFGGSYGRKIFNTIVKQVKHVLFKDKAFKWSKVFKGLLPRMHKNLFDSISAEVIDHVVDPCHEIMIEFDQKYYNPFLSKMTKAIREIDKDSIVTIDNNYFSNISIKPGIEPITVDGVKDRQQCFAPHAYDFMIDTNQYNYANDERVKFLFDRHSETANRLNMPVLVGEWGGICFKGIDWLKHIKFLINYFDDKGWSRLYWQYRDYIYADKSAFILMRPYVSEINGELLSSHYSYNSNSLKIKVRLNEGKNNLRIFSPVEVYLTGSEFITLEKFNTKEELLQIDDYFYKNILVTDDKKKQKFIDKYSLDWNTSQLEDSCFINYSLPEGEHDLIIKIKKPTNQINSLEELKYREKIHKNNVKLRKKNLK